MSQTNEKEDWKDLEDDVDPWHYINYINDPEAFYKRWIKKIDLEKMMIGAIKNMQYK